ncbi:hypothetical protein B0H10DRAFT_2200326 [Mycena sp. CBHHK59/15]|nr:hypothetical protein B0H10DRAFT_2200326 [Mycena sp. CBHHK59/15]
MAHQWPNRCGRIKVLGVRFVEWVSDLVWLEWFLDIKMGKRLGSLEYERWSKGECWRDSLMCRKDTVIAQGSTLVTIGKLGGKVSVDSSGHLPYTGHKRAGTNQRGDTLRGGKTKWRMWKHFHILAIQLYHTGTNPNLNQRHQDTEADDVPCRDTEKAEPLTRTLTGVAVTHGGFGVLGWQGSTQWAVAHKFSESAPKKGCLQNNNTQLGNKSTDCQMQWLDIMDICVPHWEK